MRRFWIGALLLLASALFTYSADPDSAASRMRLTEDDVHKIEVAASWSKKGRLPRPLPVAQISILKLKAVNPERGPEIALPNSIIAAISYGPPTERKDEPEGRRSSKLLTKTKDEGDWRVMASGQSPGRAKLLTMQEKIERERKEQHQFFAFEIRPWNMTFLADYKKDGTLLLYPVISHDLKDMALKAGTEYTWKELAPLFQQMALEDNSEGPG